jgi:hypothetical protein
MRLSLLITLFLAASLISAQVLPFTFEDGLTTEDFVDFDGGIATILANPQPSGINSSATVARIVRDGGAIFAGSKIELVSNLDFSTLNTISMKVFTTAPVGTVVKFKLENASGGSAERDQLTTVSGAWEELRWDFTGTAANFNQVVFMFDFGNVGNGSAASTFFFDDVEQFFGGNQIDLPVDFEGTETNYTTISFEGGQSFLDVDPEDSDNTVIRVLKDALAGSSAGTTIGTNAGFATNIPLTLTDARMTVRVWSPDAGIPVRLKVENSNNNTQTCETQTNTTVAGGWETLDFIFTNEATGTASLEFGLTNGWTYNKASIFFNFGTDGASAGEKTYYFDNVAFGDFVSATTELARVGLSVFPNPTANAWNFKSAHSNILAVELFNFQGQRVLSLRPLSTSATIDAALLPRGNYVARVLTTEGSAVVKLLRR